MEVIVEKALNWVLGSWVGLGLIMLIVIQTTNKRKEFGKGRFKCLRGIQAWFEALLIKP
uniref:Uncharacterized protein n=1 Tax=Solanum tuberosum TaxID=4113 RepID=Q60CW1_SOLTU|nr:hypothetical protein STB1_57t00027 [Solanum tuberosum]